MAFPPLAIDESLPADDGVVSQYPAQSRSFRADLEDWLLVEHGTVGRHAFPVLTTAAKLAITDWVAGSLVYDTTLNQLQVVETIDADVFVPAHVIATNEITTAMILNDAVTIDKMADVSVDTAQLVAGAVETAKIENLNVTLAKLATDAYVGLTAWTPAFAFGGATTGITYTTQVGRYIKIGALVIAWGTLVLSSNGSATGAITITGLPFAASTVAGAIWAGHFSHITGFDQNDSENMLTLGVQSGASAIDFWSTIVPGSSGGAADHTGEVFVVDAAAISFMVIYPTG